MSGEDFYEPVHCVVCGTTDLKNNHIRRWSPLDFLYVVCSACSWSVVPEWDENGFLRYPVKRAA